MSDVSKIVFDFFVLIYRRAFTQLSVSPEAFLTLRSHFASTHACLCICQYILGIGDRHLSNFMVDMETGGMIGIDFGHAFGSATQVLSSVLILNVVACQNCIDYVEKQPVDGHELSLF